MTAEKYKYSKLKPTRYNIPGHAHELTFSCYNNHNLLTSEFACQCVADSINNASANYQFEVWAYVLMPNHVHLLIYPTADNYNISGILRAIKQASSRKIISHYRKNQPEYLQLLKTGLKRPEYRFWQDGGGYDHNYFNDKRIRDQVEYIHRNPVRKGLADNPQDWKWSSSGFWSNGTESCVRICSDHMNLI